MEASDMLDVIHYFFDQDVNYSTGEQAEAHSAIRRNVYKDWYNQVYKYGVSTKSNSSGTQEFIPAEADFTDNEPITPVDPFKKSSKSFVPTTDFNPDARKPFGSIIDAPLG